MNKPVSTAIIFIIAVLVAVLFVIPQYHQALALQNRIAQKHAEYESQASYYLGAADVIKNIESKPDALAKIDDALPSDSTAGPLTYFLQKQASADGLTVQSITFSKDAPSSQQSGQESRSPEIKDISFEVDVAGTYQSFKNFLASLEQSDRLFQVNTIVFSLHSPSDQELLVNQGHFPAMDFTLHVVTHAYDNNSI